MKVLEYEVGYRGAFFGCLGRDVEISWEASSVKLCRVYWIDLEKTKHFIGNCPGFYKLPSLKKGFNQKDLGNHFNELVGVLRFEFEPLDFKQGVFFSTPRFHLASRDEVRWVAQGPESGWFVFDGGGSVYWSEARWRGDKGSFEGLPFTYLVNRDVWFSEILGIKKSLALKDGYCVWVQGDGVSCVDVIDVEGVPPVCWFSDGGVESWSYSHDESRRAVFRGKSFSIKDLGFSVKERFGKWELCSFLSSRNRLDVFRERGNGFQVSGLYGFLVNGVIDSGKLRYFCFFEDWLGRRFSSIMDRGEVHLFHHRLGGEWKEVGKVQGDYENFSLVEDFRGAFWVLGRSERGDIFEFVSYDGGQSWGSYRKVLMGGEFPLLVMGQKGKRMRVVVKDNRLLFSSGDSLGWWSACGVAGELRVKQDRFSVIASKDIRESWYLLVCLEDEEDLSEWVSLDECRTWSRAGKVLPY